MEPLVSVWVVASEFCGSVCGQPTEQAISFALVRDAGDGHRYRRIKQQFMAAGRPAAAQPNVSLKWVGFPQTLPGKGATPLRLSHFDQGVPNNMLGQSGTARYEAATP